jgi:hypothetical protein
MSLPAVSSLRWIYVVVVHAPIQFFAHCPKHLLDNLTPGAYTRITMPSLEKYLGEVYLWKYVPNLAAAIAFTILFLFLTMVHGWVMWRARLWFCLPFFIGGICESHLSTKQVTDR